ncbi:MAG: P-loop NTPase [Halobacteriales archaeon]|nr:P-loop NTPase [Halobacteriales archaeon]
MTGHVYAVASGKGGVGKTTTVVNLGVMLRAEGHSVALVDADLGMPNLAGMIGVDHQPTLHDILADEATVEEAINEESDGFAIIQGTHDLTGFANADPSGLRAVVEELADRYEYVILDTGPGLSHEDVLPLGIADEVILVTTPSDVSIGDVEKTDELVEIVDGATAGVVITHANQDTDAERIGERLGVTVLGVIPEDDVVSKSVAASQPLEAYDPDSRAAAAYRRLAARLIEANTPNVDALAIDDLEPSDPRPSTDTAEGSQTPTGTENETETSVPETTDDEGDAEGEGDTVGLDLDDTESTGDGDGDSETGDPESTPESASPITSSDAETTVEPIGTEGESDSEPDESRMATPTAEESTAEETETETKAETETETETAADTDDNEESAQKGGILGWFSRRLG